MRRRSRKALSGPLSRLGQSAARRQLGSHAALALLCLSTVSSCSTIRLLDERSTAPFADLVRADHDLEASPVLVGERGAAGSPVFLRSVHSTAPEATTRPVLVLLNGVFSDGDTWRFNTGPLAEKFDLLVVDLPGTGRSLASDPDLDPPEHFTPAWEASQTWAALSAWQSEQPSPRSLVLVGHSVGGAVILRMLGDPTVRARFERERVRVQGAVLIAAPDVAAPAWSPTFVRLATLGDAEIDMGDWIGFLGPEVEKGIQRSVVHPERSALQREADRFLAVLRDHDRRRASQLMLLRIRPVDDHDQPIWARVDEEAGDHGRVDVPTMLVWGRQDNALPLSTGVKLAGEIPGARLEVIDDAGHSVQQEKPLEVARAIVHFVEALGPASD